MQWHNSTERCDVTPSGRDKTSRMLGMLDADILLTLRCGMWMAVRMEALRHLVLTTGANAGVPYDARQC